MFCEQPRQAHMSTHQNPYKNRNKETHYHLVNNFALSDLRHHGKVEIYTFHGSLHTCITYLLVLLRP